MNVGQWLRELGLGDYAELFERHGVDAETLPQLTVDDLKELGIAAVGHRRKLLEAIARLRDEPSEVPASPPTSLAESPGERRQVVVMFADLVGYTRLSHELDAEEVHAILEQYFGEADKLVVEHGGHVDKHLGDAIMAVFGAPVAHGNDAERAVRAAMAIRAVMPEISRRVGRSVGVHVGIAGGQVVASGSGSSTHRAYTVVGDSVNLAARLGAAAGAEEIFVSAAVEQELGPQIERIAKEPLQLKGFEAPVPIWAIRGLASGRQERRQARVLIGRRAEFRQLEAALRGCAEDGRGQAVLLRGEAGIGKTRLTEALAEQGGALGFSCHTARIMDFGAGRGRDALQSLVRGMIGADEAIDPEAAGEALSSLERAGALADTDRVFLNDLLEIPQPAELAQRHKAMDHATRIAGRHGAAMRLVHELALRQPRLLIVEDLHWAPPTVLADLAILTAGIASSRALLLMTTRIEGDPTAGGWRTELGAGAMLTIDLGPLNEAEARQLAAPFLADNKSFADRCVARAGGNPLFLDQLLRHAEAEPDSVPGSVQSLVQARLDRLAPIERTTLQAAAILGQRIERETLAHLVGADQGAIERLVARYLLRPDGTGFLFAHAMIHDAVYDSLLRPQRRELHRRAAAWFVDRDQALYAEHAERAEAPEAPRAYLGAARAAALVDRLEDARRLAERGLALATAPADVVELALRLGDILLDLTVMPAARAAFERALGAALDEPQRCRALLGLAAVKQLIDDLAGAEADLERAHAAALAAGLGVELARTHFLLGKLCFPRGDLEGVRREHGKALELARAVGSVELEAAALGGIGDATYVDGRMRTAGAAFQTCIEVARRHGLRRVEVAHLPMAALVRWFTDGSRPALAEAKDAIAAAVAIGHRRAEAIGQHAAFLALQSLGLNADALAAADEAIRIAKEIGSLRFEAEGLTFKALAAGALDRQSEACRDARQALVVARASGLGFLGPAVLGILATVTDDKAERDACIAEAEELLAAPSLGHNHLLFRRLAIDICLDRRDWGGATHHADALDRYAQREPTVWSTHVVARGRALARAGLDGVGPSAREGLMALRAEAVVLGLLDGLPKLEAALGRAQPETR